MNTAPARQPIPVRPVDLKPSPVHLVNACYAVALAAAGERFGRDPVETCRQLYGDDAPAVGLVRAATTGAMTSVAGWAAELTQTATAAFLGALAPLSAAAQLIPRGIMAPLGDGTRLFVPGRTSGQVAPWAAESQPIAVRAGQLAGPTITPKKAAVLVIATRELFRRSAARRIFEQLLREDTALTIDSAYFSDTAASAAAHPGLLAGVAALPSAGSATEDLAQLALAVGTGGSGQVVYVTGPGRAAEIAVRMPDLATPVLASPAVAETRLIGIDPLSLVHAIDPIPSIEAATEATFHMEDTTPLDIGTVGTPAVVAAPTQNLFQTDQIALRLLITLGFAPRRSGAIAFVDNPDWSPP